MPSADLLHVCRILVSLTIGAFDGDSCWRFLVSWTGTCGHVGSPFGPLAKLISLHYFLSTLTSCRRLPWFSNWHLYARRMFAAFFWRLRSSRNSGGIYWRRECAPEPPAQASGAYRRLPVRSARGAYVGALDTLVRFRRPGRG